MRLFVSCQPYRHWVKGADRSIPEFYLRSPPKSHRKVFPALCPELGCFEEDHNQPVQRIEFVVCQVVFSNNNVLLAYYGTFQEVSPILGAFASARCITISADVCPVTA